MAQRPRARDHCRVDAGQRVAQGARGRVGGAPEQRDQLDRAFGRAAVRQHVSKGHRVTGAPDVDEIRLVIDRVLLVDRRVDRGIHRCEVVPVELRHDVETRIRQDEPTVGKHAMVLHICADAGKACPDRCVRAAPVGKALFGRHSGAPRAEEQARDHRGLSRMLTERPRAASAASIKASAYVGCAWAVRAMSSAVAPISTASAISAIKSVARGPAR